MKRPIKFTKWLLLAIPLVLLLVPAAASAEITNASITCNAGTVQASYYPSIDPVTAYQTVTIPLTVNGTKDEIVEASKFSLVKQHSYNVNIVASDFQLPADGDNSFSIQLNVQKGSASEPLPSAETICLYYNNLAITDTFQLERTHLAPRTGNLMTGFSINGIAGRINDSQNTIYVDVPYNATLETLAPVFTVSDGASVYVNGIKQASNSSTQSFTASTTSPVQYVVIAENNTSTKTYSVTVQQSANTACDILTFELPEQDHVVIDNTAGTIVVHMKSDTSFISTKPTQLVISDGATIDHPQTEFRDFSATTPVSYIVTSQDGKHSKEYKVTLGMPTSVGSSAAAITSYTLLIDGIRYTGIINESNKTVIVTLPAGVTNTTGVATYTLSTGATAQVGTVTQVNGSTSNSFASPQTYTITAQDGTTTANYTVSVTPGAAASTTTSPGATATATASATPTPGANAVSAGNPITNVEGSISVVATSGISAANPSLTTTMMFAGDVYQEMKKAVGNAKILTAYDITLVNPGTLRGPYYITFNVGRANVGRTVTILHRKSERNYETAVATVDGTGRLAMRASTLSPFMILNGYVVVSGAATEINTIPLGATGSSVSGNSGGSSGSSLGIPKTGAWDKTGVGLVFMIIAVLLAILIVLYLWFDSREKGKKDVPPAA